VIEQKPKPACVKPRTRWTTVGVAFAVFAVFASAAYILRVLAGVGATDFGVTLWPEPAASSARITTVVDDALHKERLAAWFAEQRR
jgi:hypothetical protein